MAYTILSIVASVVFDFQKIFIAPLRSLEDFGSEEKGQADFCDFLALTNESRKLWLWEDSKRKNQGRGR